ncbi:1-acyl-sn-glycerol-3-phosphate acyltransferase [Reinekea sp.]|jgi:1-acyl-sn-glycerol-3-phosphate acyltransferase|uniref:1-acyl-sn-glycerol-3-phosphate acyltransferase n=1 Tax=Reinekea sp. TaxID=1970455 RepID=UPI00398A3BB6
MQLTNLYVLASLTILIVVMNVFIIKLPRNKWEAILGMFYRNFHCIRPISNSDHATIIIANHPNAFIDPFAIEAALGIKLTRTVRADWTKHWLVRWFANAVGAIPIASKNSNKQAFKRLINTLDSGRAVILFPEGQSHNRSKLKTFKKGTAHLVKQYVEATGKPIRVVKVALYYENKSELNSDVWVDVVGETIYTDNQFNICEQTKLWQQQINDSLPHYNRTADKQRLNWALQTIMSINPSLLTSLNVLKTASTTGQMTLLRHWLSRAQYNLGTLKTKQNTFCHLAMAVAHTGVFITGIPILMFGAMLNAPAALAHYALTSWQSNAEDKWASNAFILGMSIYSVYWLVLVLVSSPLTALAIAASGIYANYFAQTWGDRKRKLTTHFGCISQPQACDYIRTIAFETVEPQLKPD